MNQHAAAPEFAMSFTQEAVLLERREGRDWRRLGQARFAEGDLAFVLNALRDDAGGQAGELDTILVIPDDQILYTSLTVPFGSDTQATIARALEAMTPYPAGDLVFDWCPAANGDIETLRVAAVTRRTLEEAEDFARAQGFRPTGFQARPEDDRFDGHPDFGTSRLVAEQFNRRPFSGPDLSQARVTAPVIDLTDYGAPSAPVSSRITPHVVTASAPVAAAGQSPADAPLTGAADAHTDEPATARPVIRHGQLAQSAPALPPRAQAVHDRAAGARALRADPTGQQPPADKPLRNWLRGLDLTRLPAMVAVLAAVLVMGLLFLGRSPDQPQTVAETTPDAVADQPVDAVAISDPAADSPLAAPPASDLADGGLPAAAPVAPDSAQPQAETPDITATGPGIAPVLPEATDPATAPAADPQQASPQAAPPQTGLAEAEPAAPAASAPALSGDGDDALTRALNEALATSAPQAPATDAITRAATAAAALMPDSPQAAAVAPATPSAEAAAAPAQSPVSSAPPPTAPSAAPPSATSSAEPSSPQPAATTAARLTASSRPPRAAPARAETPATPDPRPAVPANPAPFAQAGQAPAPQVSAARPPARPAGRPAATPASATTSAPAPAPAPAPAQTESPAARPAPSPATPPAAGPTDSPAATRPPARPANLSMLEEGSAAEEAPRRLTQEERAVLTRQLRDLRTAQAGMSDFTEAERGLVFQLADARPLRKPVSVRGPSQDAISAAVSDAVSSSDRPQPRAGNLPSATASTAAAAISAPQAGAQSGALARSTRPQARPASLATRAPAAGGAGLSAGAVEEAIAAAVATSPATPGAVALTALSSSSLPPRRTSNASAAASAASAGASTVTSNAMLAAAAPVAAAAATGPSAADLRSAAEAQAAEAAAMAAQRRQDDELQAQAEARARAQAAADARVEAQARAQAEARARAQAEAEARTAAARNQQYRPPEVENEPDVVAAIPQGAVGNAAATATVKDGIRLNSTQIIGTVGAGQASRALVRLSNGRVLTLRIGDRINGGTITEIRDSRIIYNRNGQMQALGVLNGE